jgi:simple sugar transport system permease protein
VINFALEAMLLAGAFAAVWATHVSGSPWIGLVGGAVGGLTLAGIHALVCLGFRANQIVSSIALNLLAAGLTGTLLNHVFHVYGTSPTVQRLPTISEVFHWVGSAERTTVSGLAGLSILVPCAFLVSLLVWLFLLKTPWGLALRACGENPRAGASSGLRVSHIRFGAVSAGGILAGLGGAYLSIGELAHFVERMSQGRGYLAIAALILGRWTPGGALAATLLFGFSEALSQWLSVRWSQWPPQVFLAFPYVLSLMVLLFRWGRKGPPSALGQL